MVREAISSGMKQLKKRSAAAITYTVIAMLSAAGCGGGGGGGSPTSPSTTTSPPPSPSTPTTPTTPPNPPAPSGSIAISAASVALSAKSSDFERPRQSIALVVTDIKPADVELQYSAALRSIAAFANHQVTDTGASIDVLGESPSIVGPGIHSATITFRACVRATACARELAGSPVSINVTYDIAGVTTSPTFMDVELRDNTTPQDLTRPIRPVINPAEAWTVQSNQPWLRLSRSNGAASDTSPVDITIDESQGRIPNGSHEGFVRFTSASGLSVSTRVTLAVQRTQIDTVAPRVAPLFSTDEIIVRGALFDASTVSGIRFGSTDATSFRIVSPSEIRATPPSSLAAGAHEVKLKGPAANALSLATLDVVTPALYPAARVLPGLTPYGEPVDLIYNAVRKEVLVAIDRPTPAKDFVARFSYSTGTTWTASTLYESHENIRAMSATADGADVFIAESGFTWNSGGFTDNAMALTFAQPNKSLSYIHLSGWATDFIRDVALANDGFALMVAASPTHSTRPIYRHASTRRSAEAETKFAQVTPSGATEANILVEGVVAASGDGSRVLIGDAPSGSHMYEYDASTSSLTRTSFVSPSTDIQLDRTGGRVVLNRRDVYNRNFELIGQLPSSTLAAVLAPNGTTIYTYDANGTVNNYNATTMTLTRSRPAVGSPGDHAKRVLITISPDGLTLFIAGTDALLVEPIPTTP